jgi:hypothetical protein
MAKKASFNVVFHGKDTLARLKAFHVDISSSFAVMQRITQVLSRYYTEAFTNKRNRQAWKHLKPSTLAAYDNQGRGKEDRLKGTRGSIYKELTSQNYSGFGKNFNKYLSSREIRIDATSRKALGILHGYRKKLTKKMIIALVHKGVIRGKNYPGYQKPEMPGYLVMHPTDFLYITQGGEMRGQEKIFEEVHKWIEESRRRNKL